MAKKQAAKADEDGFPVVRLTKIAPRKHDGADGMYATEVADSVEQLDEAAAFLRREIEASTSAPTSTPAACRSSRRGGRSTKLPTPYFARSSWGIRCPRLRDGFTIWGGRRSGLNYRQLSTGW